eukprot:3389967-Prymnesium_polylepis.1
MPTRPATVVGVISPNPTVIIVTLQQYHASSHDQPSTTWKYVDTPTYHKPTIAQATEMGNSAACKLSRRPRPPPSSRPEPSVFALAAAAAAAEPQPPIVHGLYCLLKQCDAQPGGRKYA